MKNTRIQKRAQIVKSGTSSIRFDCSSSVYEYTTHPTLRKCSFLGRVQTKALKNERKRECERERASYVEGACGKEKKKGGKKKKIDSFKNSHERVKHSHIHTHKVGRIEKRQLLHTNHAWKLSGHPCSVQLLRGAHISMARCVYCLTICPIRKCVNVRV